MSQTTWYQHSLAKAALISVNYKKNLAEFRFQSRLLKKCLKVWNALIHTGKTCKIGAVVRAEPGNIPEKVSVGKHGKAADKPLINGKLASLTGNPL